MARVCSGHSDIPHAFDISESGGANQSSPVIITSYPLANAVMHHRMGIRISPGSPLLFAFNERRRLAEIGFIHRRGGGLLTIR